MNLTFKVLLPIAILIFATFLVITHLNDFNFFQYKNKEIEKGHGRELKTGYFVKNDQIFRVFSNDERFLLEDISPIGFDFLNLGNIGSIRLNGGLTYEEYYKDFSGIYSKKIVYGSPCGHHSCPIKNIIVNKIKDIEGKSLSIYDKFNRIIKLDDRFYFLNQGSIYPVKPKDPDFQKLLDVDHIISENKIIYINHDKVLDLVDTKSFKNIGGNFFADTQRIYKYGRTIDLDFDYKSVKAYNSGLIQDKNGIYAKFHTNRYIKLNKLVDLKSFQKVGCKDRGCYFKDKNRIYYNWGDRNYFEEFKIEADLNTFEYIGNGLAKDKNQLFSGTKVMPDIDIESFEKIHDSYDGYYRVMYFKDNKHYYKSMGGWIKKITKESIPIPLPVFKDQKVNKKAR